MLGHALDWQTLVLSKYGQTASAHEVIRLAMATDALSKLRLDRSIQLMPLLTNKRIQASRGLNICISP